MHVKGAEIALHYFGAGLIRPAVLHCNSQALIKAPGLHWYFVFCRVTEKLGPECAAVVQIDGLGYLAEVLDGHEQGRGYGHRVFLGHDLPTNGHARGPIQPQKQGHAGRAACGRVDAVKVEPVAICHKNIAHCQHAVIAGNVGPHLVGQGLFALAHQHHKVVVFAGVSPDKAAGGALGGRGQAALLQHSAHGAVSQGNRRPLGLQVQLQQDFLRFGADPPFPTLVLGPAAMITKDMVIAAASFNCLSQR